MVNGKINSGSFKALMGGLLKQEINDFGSVGRVGGGGLTYIYFKILLKGLVRIHLDL